MVKSHLLVVHDLGEQSPGLNTLGELLSGLFKPVDDIVDGSKTQKNLFPKRETGWL